MSGRRVVLALVLVAAAIGAWAAPPERIAYQGRLTAPSGLPLTGMHTLYFSLYQGGTAEGAAGTLVYRESVTVPLNNGTVSHAFGTGTPLAGGAFGSSMLDYTGDIYMGVAVDSPSNEILPRQRLESVPFALRAADSQMLDGKPGSEFAPEDHTHDPDSYQGVITVAKSGGQFDSIQAALSSISDATSVSRYLVRVAPGIFEGRVSMKQYVDVEGAGENLTIIRSRQTFNGASSTVGGTGNSEIRNLTIENLDSAIACTGLSNGSIFGGTSARNVTIISAGTGACIGISARWNEVYQHVTVVARGADTNIGISLANEASIWLNDVSTSATGGASRNTALQVGNGIVEGVDVRLEASGTGGIGSVTAMDISSSGMLQLRGFQAFATNAERPHGIRQSGGQVKLSDGSLTATTGEFSYGTYCFSGHLEAENVSWSAEGQTGLALVAQGGTVARLRNCRLSADGQGLRLVSAGAAADVEISGGFIEAANAVQAETVGKIRISNSLLKGALVPGSADLQLYGCSTGPFGGSADNLLTEKLTVMGATVLGDAAGDSLVINPATVQFPNATGVGNGLTLGADVRLYRNNPGQLRVSNSIQVDGTAQVLGDLNVTGDVIANGPVVMTRRSQAVIHQSTLTPSAGYMVLTPAANIPTTLGAAGVRPAIADGQSGQLLILQGTSNTGAISVVDQNAQAGSNVELIGNDTKILGVRSTLTLIYDGSDWVELARTTN